MRDYFEAVTALARRLALLIGDSLGDRDAIADACLRSDTSFLRLNFYPVEDPMAGEAADRADLGVHHHTDSGVLTVLLQDEVRGLQVYRDGRWYGIEPVAGAFTINIADMFGDSASDDPLCVGDVRVASMRHVFEDRRHPVEGEPRLDERDVEALAVVAHEECALA